MELFLVGGAVRDRFLDRDSKDWDFTVTGPTTFAEFVQQVEAEGFEIFLADEQHMTIRARAPKGWTFGAMVPPVNTFDFVLARRDVSTDGRRAVTEPGTLHDDLARRDFTMNAIAIDSSGSVIDPFGGVADIEARLIRTVGMPKARFREDGLRVLRAIRFAIVLGFQFDMMLELELNMRGMHWLNTGDVSIERTREELHKCFKASTIRTLRVLDKFKMTDDLFGDDLWLKPTVEG